MKKSEGSKSVVGNSYHFSQVTFGEKAADFLARWAGSWFFIIFFFSFICVWMVINISGYIFHQWDRFPFILLNLVLSCLAAIQAPIILMSQNRQAKKDRLRLDYDYSVNRKAEREIEEVQEKLERIDKNIEKYLGVPKGKILGQGN